VVEGRVFSKRARPSTFGESDNISTSSPNVKGRFGNTSFAERNSRSHGAKARLL